MSAVEKLYLSKGTDSSRASTPGAGTGGFVLAAVEQAVTTVSKAATAPASRTGTSIPPRG
ncbi:hypothetical protein GCM10022224_016720 [Nonomuraea antimicrobica]|uniref:Uncharacterized protein n=1 Tax=Nonomuraea antimicrobica TaxID=561173 RepID=A0ABP7BC24_9ACTN